MAYKRQPFINLTLKLIESKQQFDKIVPDKPKGKQKNTQLTQKAQLNKQNAQDHLDSDFNSEIQKEDIIIPRYGKILKPSQFKPQNPRPRLNVQKNGYIRLKIIHNLPNPFIYELTEQDLAVLKFLQQKYTPLTLPKFSLQQKHMALTFKTCEDLIYSQNKQLLSIVNDENLLIEHVSSDIGRKFNQKQREIIFQMFSQVFRYWKMVKKDHFDQPIVRKYWPKGNLSHQTNLAWIPYKTRSPGIFQPLQINNQLRAINWKKTPQQKNGIKIISSLQEWKILYDTHRRKRKEFQKTMKNFHSLAKIYGLNSHSLIKNQFKKSLQDLEKPLEKNNQQKQRSRENPSKVSQSSRQILKLKEHHQIGKLPKFKNFQEWYRNKKKILRKEKRLANFFSSRELNQSYQNSIEIQDDFDDDLQVIDEKHFHNLLFLKVEKDLEQQKEVFRLKINEQEQLDDIDSQLGSENFYPDLDWDIKEPQDLFSQKSQVQKEKNHCQKPSQNYQSYSSDTTIYQNSEEFQDKKVRRKIESKQTRKQKLLKKVKRL